MIPRYNPKPPERRPLGVMNCSVGGGRLTLNIVGIASRRHPEFDCVQVVFSCCCAAGGDFTFSAAMSERNYHDLLRPLSDDGAAAA